MQRSRAQKIIIYDHLVIYFELHSVGNVKFSSFYACMQKRKTNYVPKWDFVGGLVVLSVGQYMRAMGI